MVIRLIDISQFTWDLYNSADRVYYIGSKTIDKCKTDSKALKKEKKYWRKEQKFSIKHNILPTEEMYTWLDKHADYENSTNWYEVFHEQFAQWYISEKYNEFEKFVTKIRMSAANETLIITDDNPDEWWSIRSIIGGILNRHQHNGFVRDREWDWQTAYGFTEDEEPIPGYTLYKDYLNYYLFFQEQNYYMPITQTIDSKGNPKTEYGVHRGYKMRIYPDRRQEWEFNKTIQACEYIYNRILAEQRELDRKHIEDGASKIYYDKYDVDKRIQEIKKEPGNEWMNDEGKQSKAYKDRQWTPRYSVLQGGKRKVTNRKTINQSRQHEKRGTILH